MVYFNPKKLRMLRKLGSREFADADGSVAVHFDRATFFSIKRAFIPFGMKSLYIKAWEPDSEVIIAPSSSLVRQLTISLGGGAIARDWSQSSLYMR